MTASLHKLKTFHSNSVAKNRHTHPVDNKILANALSSAYMKNTATCSITSFRPQLNAATRQLLCCCMEEKEDDEALSTSVTNSASISDVTDTSVTIFSIETTNGEKFSANTEVTEAELEDTQQRQKPEFDAFQQAVELLTEEEENELLNASDIIAYNDLKISREHLDSEDLFLSNRPVLSAVRKKPRA